MSKDNCIKIIACLTDLVDKSIIVSELLTPDFNYRDTGLIDSLEFIRFILTLEKEYSIKFTDAEIESAEFNTIYGLTHIIQEKTK